MSILHVEGEVLQISLFNTILGHPDLSRVVLPNRKIVGEILHNYGRIRQAEVVVSGAYDTDLNQAIAAFHEILQANALVLKDPKAVGQVALLADSSIDIAVEPWTAVQDRVDAASEINKAIVETFRSRSISIPFPQREVRIRASAA